MFKNDIIQDLQLKIGALEAKVNNLSEIITYTSDTNVNCYGFLKDASAGERFLSRNGKLGKIEHNIKSHYIIKVIFDCVGIAYLNYEGKCLSFISFDLTKVNLSDWDYYKAYTQENEIIIKNEYFSIGNPIGKTFHTKSKFKIRITEDCWYAFFGVPPVVSKMFGGKVFSGQVMWLNAFHELKPLAKVKIRQDGTVYDLALISEDDNLQVIASIIDYDCLTLTSVFLWEM